MNVGETRIVFTSREALPAPFDAERHRRELHRLDRDDAVKLVERALNADEGAGSGRGARRGRANRSRRWSTPSTATPARSPCWPRPCGSQGVEATRDALVELMVAMEKQFPGSREQSLFASVELSLRRMSPANRDRARVLGVFHGGVDLDMLRDMMQWEEADVASLAGELIETGLATPNRYNHLTLNPALCPYLRGELDVAEREALTSPLGRGDARVCWLPRAAGGRNAEVAATLTVLELPNLFALLEQVQRAGDAEATIGLGHVALCLLQTAGKPRLLERMGTGARCRSDGTGRNLESCAV